MYLKIFNRFNEEQIDFLFKNPVTNRVNSKKNDFQEQSLSFKSGPELRREVIQKVVELVPLKVYIFFFSIKKQLIYDTHQYKPCI